MAKISALTDGDPAVATDHVVVARGAGNFKLLLSALKTLFNTSPTITGTASHTTTPIYHAYNVGVPGDANYERAALWWTGNDYVIGLEQGGTGSAARQLHLRGGASGQVRLMVGSTTLSTFTASSTGIGNSGNVVVFGTANPTAGAVTSRTEINKAVTAFSDNVAKAVLTFTVPNAAHSASFLIRIVGSMGAGGDIGANESTQSATYIVDITRTAGVNAVATIGATYGQPAAATVAGGDNIATTAALSAISGAVGAANTFTVNATLARDAGAADNHTAVVHCSLLNANATGVTVA